MSSLTTKTNMDNQCMTELNMSAPPVFSEFVLLDLWFYVKCFVDRCLSSCPLSVGHCVVSPSSTYGF